MTPLHVAILEEALALRLAVESLRHPKHATVLVPLRARLAVILRRRWRRQQRDFLREADHWLQRIAKGHTEAQADEYKRLQGQVKARINAGTALSSSPSNRDTIAYSTLIEEAADGAILNFTAEMGIAAAQTAGTDFAKQYLQNKGFSRLAADIDETTRDRMANAVAETFSTGGSYSDAVQAIKDTFSEMKDSRAETIAQTELADAYNQAMLSSAKEAGDELLKVWNLDGEGCEEICVPNEGDGAIPIDEDFSSGDDAPPAHPNAVFEGSAFIPYGMVQRMVSAEYDGLAIQLDAGQYRTTIGPNHPMLTARGMVLAKAIEIGDQLVCDRRVIGFPRRLSDADFDQVERIEDSFRALDATFSHARVAATADDLHGDAAFCQKEIDVILPNRVLLREFQACGLERLRKCGLVEADVQPEHAPTVRFSNEQLHRFLLASSSRVRWSDVCHYAFLTVKATTTRKYKGRAFDATTLSGLYCSDGFVVSNCDCSIGFVRASEE